MIHVSFIGGMVLVFLSVNGIWQNRKGMTEGETGQYVEENLW